MQLNKKKALMLSTLQTLDDVEYMEALYQGDGVKQYCDTGRKIDWSKDTHIKIITSSERLSRGILFGSYYGDYTFNLEWHSSRKPRAYLSAISGGAAASQKIFDEAVPSGLVVVFDFTWNHSTGSWTFSVKSLDGTTYNQTYTTTTSPIRSGVGANNMYLFSDPFRINNQGSDLDGLTRIYQLEWIENGVTVAKYLPKVRNGVPYMYDEVNHLCLFNQGGGTFSTGRKVREVEYISLDGTQYFNTRFSANTLSTTAKGKFSIDNAYAFMEGSRISAGDYPKSASFYMAVKNSSFPYSRFRMDWIGADSFFSNALTSNVHEFEITGNYAKIDGVEYTDTTKTSVDMTNTYYIGACKTGTSSSLNYPLHGDIYYRQLLNTTTRELYRDYIPAIDENGVGFLFDRVSHTVFLPETGTITKYGRRIIPVDFIQSTGQQYIKTPIMPKYNHTIDISVMGFAITNLVYMGSRTSGSYLTSQDQIYVNSNPSGGGSNSIVFYHPSADYVVETYEIGKKYNLSLDVDMASGTTFSYPYYLFALNNIGTTTLATNQLRVYSCKVSTPSAVECDYAPSIDENKVAFMFDKVSHTILDNAGDGKFLFGNKKGWIDGLYEQVEYLECTGTQYINLGVVPTNTTGFKIKHTICPDNSTDNILIGCRGSYDDTRFWLDMEWGPTDSIAWGFGTYSATGSSNRYSILDKVGYIVETSCNFLNSRKCAVDNNTYPLPQATLPTITRPMYLFCANDRGTAGLFTKSRVYEVQISNGSSISHYFIPVRRITDGVFGMYDKINKVFLTNQGTGTFVAGEVL